MRILICGGGVIGASIAFFLSRAGAEVIVIERTGIACAASGKSGGFLALDWCDGSPQGALARRSFALHAELTQTINENWGYRRLDTLNVVASARRSVEAWRRQASPAWLAPEAAVHARLGTRDTTAQIDPAAFTKAMLNAALAMGAELRIGTVTGVALNRNGSAAMGAVVDGRVVEADALVIAMGPWSELARQWLPLPPVHGLKSHSLVLGFEPPAGPEALFVELETADGDAESPEVVPRPDGTTWICGVSSTTPLPEDPADVVADDGAVEKLRALAGQFAPGLADAPVLASQACYRPFIRDGLPVIGLVPDVERAWIATGHSVWGMLNAPATGEAMADMILHGETRAVDLAPFDPGRMAAGQPKTAVVTSVS